MFIIRIVYFIYFFSLLILLARLLFIILISKRVEFKNLGTLFIAILLWPLFALFLEGRKILSYLFKKKEN